MRSLLILLILPRALADHGAHTDLAGARTVFEQSTMSGMKTVLSTEIVDTAAKVTVYPCYGSFDWHVGTQSTLDETAAKDVAGATHVFTVTLDATHEDGMHGQHIVESFELTGLTVGETLYVTLDGNKESDLVAQVEILQGGVPSMKPVIEEHTLAYELDANDGTVAVTWAEASIPDTFQECASLEYVAYYHKQGTMHTGMVMGTYCGTTHTTSGDHDDMHGDAAEVDCEEEEEEDHSGHHRSLAGRRLLHGCEEEVVDDGAEDAEDSHDHSGHLRRLDHGDHGIADMEDGDHDMDATDIHMLVPVTAVSSTHATIPDLDYSSEYHVEVMAVCKNAAGVAVSGASYQPFMLEGDWFVVDEINVFEGQGGAASRSKGAGLGVAALLVGVVVVGVVF